VKPSINRRWSLALALSLGLSGCSTTPSPESALRVDDCMKGTSLSALSAAIKACNAVIRAYPHHPLPFKDRALLWSLSGNEIRACQDLKRSLSLAQQPGADISSQRLLGDLKISLRTCPGPEHQP
jgi:hypothetical protein